MSAAQNILPTLAPATWLGAVLCGLPLYEAVSADLKKGTVTFRLPEGERPGKGWFAVLPQEFLSKAMAEDVAEEDASVVLQRLGATKATFHTYAREQSVWIEDEDGNQINLWNRCASVERDGADPRVPSWWSGHELRRDAAGMRWTRILLPMVMDDFGTLVPIGRG